MNISSVHYNTNRRKVTLHEDLFLVCENNSTSAILLNYFLEKITGKSPCSQTLDEIKENILDIYSVPTIRKAIAHLVSLGFIEISNNPNPRCKFDRSQYFSLSKQQIQLRINVVK